MLPTGVNGVFGDIFAQVGNAARAGTALGLSNLLNQIDGGNFQVISDPDGYDFYNGDFLTADTVEANQAAQAAFGGLNDPNVIIIGTAALAALVMVYRG